MPVEHFRDKGAYDRWNAYRHIHGIAAPHLREVVVGGRRYKVQHSRGKLRARRRK